MSSQKIEVLIDFEAISFPFSSWLNLKIHDWPYAYTIGIFDNNQWKIATKLFIVKKRVYRRVRILLTRDIAKLTGSHATDINFDNVTFIGWNPILEKKILTKAFSENIQVKNLNPRDNQSLTTLSNRYVKKRSYFRTFLQVIVKNTEYLKMLNKRRFNTGLIAAIAGYFLFCQKFNLHNNRNYHECQINKLREEIKIYSADDVHRMKHFYLHSQDMQLASDQWAYTYKNKELQTKINQRILRQSRLKAKITFWTNRQSQLTAKQQEKLDQATSLYKANIHNLQQMNQMLDDAKAKLAEIEDKISNNL